tara:strand:+ start:1964 stop:2791 length:828 start_codon:yes stop_codon:yes gene_type:complete
MREFGPDEHYFNLKSLYNIDQLKLIYDELMSECWKDMEPILKERAYVHCYLYHTKPIFAEDKILEKESLRKMYNSIRGFDDPTDKDSFIGEWCKTWTYDTGWMLYFYAGPENCKSGDDKSFQNIYKFIPNQKTLDKYKVIVDGLKEQIKKEVGHTLVQLMYTLLPVGSGLDWHVDTGMVGRFHSVIKNDGKTPSMIFKQNGKLKNIPAVQGETYYANINVPHCVPLSEKPRLHLLGCVADMSKDNPDHLVNLTRHQHMGESDKTWADWKKDLGVE